MGVKYRQAMRMNGLAASLLVLAMMVAAQSVAAQAPPKMNGSAAPPAPSVRPKPPRAHVLPAPPPAPTQTPAPTPARTQTAAPARSPFDATPSTYAPHYTTPFRRRPERFHPFSPGYAPGYGYEAPFSGDAVQSAVAPHDLSGGQLDASGRLELDVEPRSAQVYVDGFYVGTVDDFWRSGVTLPAGRHWVDLRSPGYEMLTIPVDIAARALGQPTRFRGVLTALHTPPPQAIPARRPETMYVIPGCYAGNRPPRQSTLARGCDVAGLYVLTDPH